MSAPASETPAADAGGGKAALPAHLEPHRLAMREMTRAMMGPCDLPFRHAGVIFSQGVKPYQVAAYVRARFEGRQDLTQVAAAALVGEVALREFGNDPGWLGWTIAQGYAARMAEVEATLPAAMRPPAFVAERVA